MRTVNRIDSINSRVGKMVRAGGLMWLLAAVLSAAACDSNSGPRNENRPAAPTSEKKLTGLERDIESMRTAEFEYIFVFRRKDGQKFDLEDKKYLKENSPAETNRFVVSEDEKTVIAGSSFEFKPKVLEQLGKRFDIEDLSNAREGNSDSNQSTRPENGR